MKISVLQRKIKKVLILVALVSALDLTVSTMIDGHLPRMLGFDRRHRKQYEIQCL
jgi:hypothetical protein